MLSGFCSIYSPCQKFICSYLTAEQLAIDTLLIFYGIHFQLFSIQCYIVILAVHFMILKPSGRFLREQSWRRRQSWLNYGLSWSVLTSHVQRYKRFRLALWIKRDFTLVQNWGLIEPLPKLILLPTLSLSSLYVPLFWPPIPPAIISGWQRCHLNCCASWLPQPALTILPKFKHVPGQTPFSECLFLKSWLPKPRLLLFLLKWHFFLNIQRPSCEVPPVEQIIRMLII